MRLWKSSGECEAVMGDGAQGHRACVTGVVPLAHSGHHPAPEDELRVSAVASCSRDGRILVWTLSEEVVTVNSEGTKRRSMIDAELSHEIEGHHGGIYCMAAFLPRPHLPEQGIWGHPDLSYGRFVTGA